MSDQIASFANQQSPSEAIAALQTELDQLRHELEHSHRLATLGVLAAGIAHEINNVLTPVLAYAQLASSNPSDPQFQAKALKKAVTGVETATQIAHAILGFAGQPNQPGVANILETLNSAVDCLGRNPQKDKIQLVVHVHPEAHVQMRPLALQQILMNLILNARAALEPRGGRLTITARTTSTGATEITCADTGPGIPEEMLERLFVPFANVNRSSATTARKSSRSSINVRGTGLGLAICKRLVDEVGGTIAVSSKQGDGTKFTITLRSASAQIAA